MAKHTVDLISVKISHDGNEYDIPQEQVNVYSSSQECDLCGSHGDTTMDVTCPCGKDHEVHLSSW